MHGRRLRGLKRTGHRPGLPGRVRRPSRRRTQPPPANIRAEFISGANTEKFIVTVPSLTARHLTNGRHTPCVQCDLAHTSHGTREYALSRTDPRISSIALD